MTDHVERDRREREHKHRLMRGEGLDELRGMSEADLLGNYDALTEETARATDRDAQLRYILRAQVHSDELTRRETAKLTKRLNFLTWVLAGLTVAGVIITALTFIYG